MAIDLRQEMNALLKKWGHDILLQRRTLKSKSGIYATADNNGFSTKLERWTVRHSVQRESQLIAALRPKPEGMLAMLDLLYYFPWDANPKDGDRIYEIDQRYDTNIQDSVKYASTSIIEYAQAMRGVGGRIEFWIAGSMRERPN